ncbi:MAG: DUF1993 domain-containing protein [Deltaproteobacteria bacterium]|nr:DUF1993 domain-containing protein [Deltaproteobacteria bacterium]
MYFHLFAQMKKQLRQVDRWFDKAEAHAKARGFDPDLLVAVRLAPDQFGLARQIDSACDTAKLGASRLTGKDAPKNDDDEKTIAELRARVASAIAYLDSFTEKDFEGAATRTVTTPRWEGRTMTGHDYFLEHALPNFYFHLAHAYAILRASGVDVGKRDYLGALTQTKP